ncbi:uncharacterized protein LOC110724778 [Chenopodium quinoa]|uniref:uncharacterized protein LOC110724778 n=1 Tax=Chenopodium quinoa TaxID=63459 RepID=UPI000B76E727|nr:uncharacterized protein LOC110724778 [Chenopodium quinoa]
MRLFIDISGIHINSIVLDRLEGDWDADEEEEFKTLFLMVALQMVLCPTQSPRLAADLVPALTCARECAKYDWCGLLLNKLMDSVLNFACRFYGTGFASGCGGCTMFLVVHTFKNHVYLLKMLDVVYGEQHPLAARDTNGPTHQTEVGFAIENPHDCKLKKKRRGATSNKSPHDRKAEKALISPKLGSSNCPLPVMDCLFVRLLFFLV